MTLTSAKIPALFNNCNRAGEAEASITLVTNYFPLSHSHYFWKALIVYWLKLFQLLKFPQLSLHLLEF